MLVSPLLSLTDDMENNLSLLKEYFSNENIDCELFLDQGSYYPYIKIVFKDISLMLTIEFSLDLISLSTYKIFFYYNYQGYESYFHTMNDCGVFRNKLGFQIPKNQFLNQLPTQEIKHWYLKHLFFFDIPNER